MKIFDNLKPLATWLAKNNTRELGDLLAEDGIAIVPHYALRLRYCRASQPTISVMGMDRFSLSYLVL